MDEATRLILDVQFKMVDKFPPFCHRRARSHTPLATMVMNSNIPCYVTNRPLQAKSRAAAKARSRPHEAGNCNKKINKNNPTYVTKIFQIIV